MARHTLAEAQAKISRAIALRYADAAWMQRHSEDFRKGFKLAGLYIHASLDMRLVGPKSGHVRRGIQQDATAQFQSTELRLSGSG